MMAVIGMPVFADQLVLCARVRDTKAGLCLSPLTSPWQPWELSDAILTFANVTAHR
jgi:UDP:flavonoid glycosyltransferase YjiC (YdhE family)